MALLQRGGFGSRLQAMSAVVIVCGMPDSAEQSGLFDQDAHAASAGALRPLAVRMRPRCLADVIGQDHVVGAGVCCRA